MGFSERANKFNIVLLVNGMCADRKFSDITVGDICQAAGISHASSGYWTTSKCNGDVRVYAAQLADCVPVDLFEALNVPVDPKSVFEVNASTLAHAAQEMDEGFCLGV